MFLPRTDGKKAKVTGLNMYWLYFFQKKTHFNHIIKISFLRFMSFLNYAGDGLRLVYEFTLSSVSKKEARVEKSQC